MDILESLKSLDERAEEMERASDNELIRTIVRPLINLAMAQERERQELLTRLDALQGKPQESPAIKNAEGVLG